jgi:hypothetical protein
MEGLPDEALAQVAAYFQTLSEPTRLQILNLLRQRERSVGELAQLCGYSSANISLSTLGHIQPAELIALKLPDGFGEPRRSGTAAKGSQLQAASAPPRCRGPGGVRAVV